MTEKKKSENKGVKKVKLLRALLINGEKHKVGEVLEMTDADIKRFGADVEVIKNEKKRGD